MSPQAVTVFAISDARLDCVLARSESDGGVAISESWSSTCPAAKELPLYTIIVAPPKEPSTPPLRNIP